MEDDDAHVPLNGAANGFAVTPGQQPDLVEARVACEGPRSGGQDSLRGAASAGGGPGAALQPRNMRAAPSKLVDVGVEEPGEPGGGA